MGLVVNIESWPLSAAVAMATEGIRAKYTTDAGGGGFGAAAKEIGAKLDGAKVLNTLDEMLGCAPHLVHWSLFAYASPSWNNTKQKEKLIDCVVSDWVAHQFARGVCIQKRTYERVRSLVPFIAGGLAMEQNSGVDTVFNSDGVTYSAVAPRGLLIEVLVQEDCIKNDCTSETYKKKRTRYYQSNWDRINGHVDAIRDILISYDKAAQILYTKTIDLIMMSN